LSASRAIPPPVAFDQSQRRIIEEHMRHKADYTGERAEDLLRIAKPFPPRQPDRRVTRERGFSFQIGEGE
jgi:hypothetical protein